MTQLYGNFHQYYEFNPDERILKLVSSLNVQVGSKTRVMLLDVGCNQGDLTVAVLQRFSQMLGIDLDQELIERAKKSVSQPNIDFQHLNVMESSLPARHYDVIFCFSTTMWLHLNYGDEGLIRFLRTMASSCDDFVVEPQNWKSYLSAKKRRKREKLEPHALWAQLKICNHPNILEKVDSGLGSFFFSPRDRLVGRTNLAMRRVSPVTASPVALQLPVLLFLAGTPALLGSSGSSPTRLAALSHLAVWRTAHIHDSSLSDGLFSFVRLTEFTASELNSLFYDLSLAERYHLYQQTQHDLASRHLPLSEICEQTLDRRVPLAALVTLPQQIIDQPLLSALRTTPLQRQFSLWPALRQTLLTPRVLSAPPLPFCSHPSFHQHLARDLFPPAFLPKPLATPHFFYTSKALAAPRPPPPPSQLGSLVRDAGKLLMLDRMLPLLKLRGHRVLMYSQFTKMIDVLEEYLTQRRHRYVRLDGSSKLEDRRDMVEDWQTKPEIFVFLLSTRAGGLGINLTSADTVIFYDSDWNPTIDEQAMDRAHRLGQRKTVSVYRLVVEGSVEDKILKRAKMKHYIQSLVVAGGAIDNEALTADEAKDLLLDEEEMALAAKSGQMANGGKKARFSISSTRY